jgi:uncharacterized membrane protein (DUF373 family)
MVLGIIILLGSQAVVITDDYPRADTSGELALGTVLTAAGVTLYYLKHVKAEARVPERA